jgi:hypothetical protein
MRSLSIPGAACPPACLSLQLAYKDDIHCASLQLCRTGWLVGEGVEGGTDLVESKCFLSLS